MSQEEWREFYRRLEDLDIPGEQRAGLRRSAERLEGRMGKLATLRQHLQSLLDSTVDGIITIDEEGIVQSFNPAAERIFGYTAAEMIGEKVEHLMPPPDAHHHTEYIRRYLESGEPRIIGIGREVTGKRKNGECFPLELSVSELREGDRRIFTGIARDISERKQAEAALEQERSFINAVFDTVGAIIIVLSPRGHVVRLNRACERITGYRTEDLQGTPFWEHLVPEEEVSGVRKVFRELSRDSLPNQYENTWITRRGRRRRISWSNTVLLDRDGTVQYVIGTGIDITEQARSQEAIVAVSEAERKVIGQELHDALGQEMTGITLLAGALQMKLAQQDRDEQRDAAELTRLAQNVLGSVKQLAHGLYPTDLEKSGLSAALTELADTQNRHTEIECAYVGDRDAPPLPPTTELHLYRIAQEATSNAIRHSGASRLMIHYAVEGRLVTLAIEDDGRGIPSPPPRGSGMGLTIMRYRAVEVGGDLELAARPGGGTIVRCSLVLPA